MKIQVVLVFSACALIFPLCGCTKKENAEQPVSVAPKQVSVSDQAGEAAAPPPGTPAAAQPAAPQPADDRDDLTRIIHAMQSFAVNNERPPKDLNELVKAKLLPSVPVAPPGKKYLYDPNHMSIKLVNQ